MDDYIYEQMGDHFIKMMQMKILWGEKHVFDPLTGECIKCHKQYHPTLSIICQQEDHNVQRQEDADN